MSILNKLSSMSNEKPTIANKLVSNECISNPELIEEIVNNINSKNHKLAFDCAEVLTMIAEYNPNLILPYTESIFKYLKHKKSNIRWEIAHSLALSSHLKGKFINEKIDEILEVIAQDDSIVVRDYAIDILVGYALIGEHEAITVYPYLVKSLSVHNARHAGHVIDGFVNVVKKTNIYNNEILELLEPFLEDKKKVVVQKAKRLTKLIAEKH